MLLLFLIVAQHESGTRKQYLGQWSNIKKNYTVNATAQIEQVQDKKKHQSIIFKTSTLGNSKKKRSEYIA
jgi:hypothetical protein